MNQIYGNGSWLKTTRRGKEYHLYKVYVDGKQKSFYGKTKKEALDKYKAYISGTVSKKSKDLLTVCDVGVEMLELKKSQIKPTTYDSYFFQIQNLRKIPLGNFQIKSVTIKDLQEYVDSMTETSTYSSIKTHRTFIRMLFKYAAENDYIRKDISSILKLPNRANIKKPSKKIAFLSTKERHMIEKEAVSSYPNGEKKYENSGEVIIFLLHTGLRISELLPLTWEDVDMDLKVVGISKNAPISKNYEDDAEKRYSAKITTPKKMASYRSVPLDDTALGIIQSIRERKKHQKSDLIFCSRTGGMLSRKTLARNLEKMAQRAGIDKKPSLHDLRHTYASELIRNGINVKKVSQILGHSDISTTLNIYVHVGEDEYDDVRDALN